MATTTHEQRIAELLELAAAEGFTLPLPAALIARLEDGGAVVDLVTGAIIPGGAEQRYTTTLLGDANAVVWAKERGQ